MSRSSNWLLTRGIETLLVGIAVAVLLRLVLFEPSSPLQEKGVPLETHADMLMVVCTFNRDAPPQINSLQYLEQGRVTVVSAPGDYAIELLDETGQVKYRLSFNVSFVRMVEPPQELERVQQSFVVPFSQEVAAVRLVAPQGQVEMTVP